MIADPYQAPSTNVQVGTGATRARSRRFVQSFVAAFSGFFSLPAAYVALRITDNPAVKQSILERATIQDLVACGIAALIAALAVSPFRRLPLWACGLAGLLPLALFLAVAVVIVVSKLTA